MNKLQSAIAVVLILPAMTVPGMSDETVDYDTTRVRYVEPVKKSTGDKVADIPGEVLKLPVYAVEITTYALVSAPPLKNILSLVKIGEKAKPYVPIVGYGGRSGLKLGFGLKLLNTKSEEGQLKLKLYYSTFNYQSYQAQYGSSLNLLGGSDVNLYTRYKKRPREAFYGVGMQSDVAREVSYTLENTEFRLRFTRQVTSRVSVALTSRYEATNISDGHDPKLEGNIDTILADPAFTLVPAQFESLRHADIGVSLEFDGRNSKGQPTRGSHLFAHYERLFGVGTSSDRNFDRYGIDYRQYLTLWRKRVLAIRAFASRIASAGSAQPPIPFYLAGQMGGADRLRGYNKGRFVDNDLMLVSVEYRYPIYDVVDAFLFWDEGRVFSNITKESVFENWRSSFGFGIRVWSVDNVIAVAQIARSQESTRFYFELGASW